MAAATAGAAPAAPTPPPSQGAWSIDSIGIGIGVAAGTYALLTAGGAPSLRVAAAVAAAGAGMLTAVAIPRLRALTESGHTVGATEPPSDETLFRRHYVLGAATRVWLFTRTWSPPSSVAARGVVHYYHGFGEHCGRHAHVAERLAARGFIVCAHDHAGHGQSEGDRGYVTRFADMTADAVAVMLGNVELAATLPQLIMGHSMGALLAIHVASDPAVRSRVAGVVLSGTALAFDPKLDTPLNRLAAHTLSAWLPKLTLDPLDANELCTNVEVVRAYRRDPMVYTGESTRNRMAQYGWHERATAATQYAHTSLAGALSVRYGAEMMRAVDAVFATGGLADTWSHPTLMLHGEDDRICLPIGARRFHAAVSARRTTPATAAEAGGASGGAGTAATATPAIDLRLYPGAMHEIFNETLLPAPVAAAGSAGRGSAGESVSQCAIREAGEWLERLTAAAAASR